MQSYKLLHHWPFTHTYFEYIFASKILNYAFNKSLIPFNPETTGVIDGGMMGFMDSVLLTWFRLSSWILNEITSRDGTSWVWRSFPKWSRSAYSVLVVIGSYIDIYTFNMAGCDPSSNELMQLLILFIVSLRIWTPFIEDAPSLFASKALVSTSDVHLLAS